MWRLAWLVKSINKHRYGAMQSALHLFRAFNGVIS